MNVPIAIAWVVVFISACALAVLLRKVASPRRRQLVTAEWLNRYSAARYRPVERLISEEDYRYLASQKGYRPGIARQLRRERVKVFRSYLMCLRRDFHRLETALSLCMVDSCADRPDLAKILLQHRLVFTYALLIAEWHLVLYRFGLGTVDVRHLVGSLDGMRVQVGQMALARQASLA